MASAAAVRIANALKALFGAGDATFETNRQNAVDCWIADHDGHVRYTTVTATTVNPSTWTVVPYDTKVTDDKGWYSTGTGRFQPTIPGLYHVSAFAILGSVPGSALQYMSVWKNGVQYARMAYGRPGGEGLGGSCVVDLNGSTDYIEVRVFQSDAVAHSLTTGAGDNHLGIARLPGSS